MQSQDNPCVIIKSPKIWPIWCPPPPNTHRHTHKSPATGLSAKEDSDEGAEKEDSDEGAEKEDSDEGEEKGVRGVPPKKNFKNGQIQLDHKIIVKGPKIWPIWPPPPKKKKKKKKKKKSLATGLSAKEISDEGTEKEDSNEGAEKEDSDEGAEKENSDEGAEKEDSDEGVEKEDSDEGTKKILMKEQTQGGGGGAGGHLIPTPPHSPTPNGQIQRDAR